VLLLAVLLAPALARAQMEELPPGVVESTTHRHLGFFLRMELGADYFHTTAPAAGVTPCRWEVLVSHSGCSWAER